MLRPLAAREEVHRRLLAIFPEGIQHRTYVTRMLAASTVFTALYIGAIEGENRWLGPKHVYRMTEQQASRETSDEAREAYAKDVMKPGGFAEGVRWYQDNTREPIRDETLREGLVALGAVVERPDVPTTSSSPRYALEASFAALFDPQLSGDALETAIDAWRAARLNPGALARIAIVRGGAGKAAERVLVALPNGETHGMRPGPSSVITKAVIEEFAPRFLTQAAVLFVSESGAKVVARYDDLARSIGLEIKADRTLPDIILADLSGEHPLLVFVEVVASDGPINERRKTDLATLAAAAGFPVEHVAYVTAFLDRSRAPFKKAVDDLAWGSYAWFAAEPERLVAFHDAAPGLR